MPEWIKRFLPFLSLLVLGILIAALEPRFLSAGNLASVARQTAVITIMAMGMTMVMVSGGIDLSVGSMTALCGVTGAMAMAAGAPVLVGIAVAVAVGIVLGLINGMAVASLGIPPFIVTLGAMGVYRGTVLLISEGNAVVGLPSSFGYLAEGNLFGFFPIPLVIVVAVLVRTLDPQQCGDDSRVAPDAHGLLRVFLVLVRFALVAGGLEQVGLRVRLALSGHEDEIVGEDAIHRDRIVCLDGSLILRVERGDGGLVVVRGGVSNTGSGERDDCGCQTTGYERHGRLLI